MGKIECNSPNLHFNTFLLFSPAKLASAQLDSLYLWHHVVSQWHVLSVAGCYSNTMGKHARESFYYDLHRKSNIAKFI